MRRTQKRQQVYHRLFFLSTLLCTLSLPSTAQYIALYPPVDTLALWGTCTPADFFWRPIRYSSEIERIVIRAHYGELILGVPPVGIIARYDSAYFQIRDSLGIHQYQLSYTNHSPDYPAHCSVPYDSLVVAFPGRFDLTLYVLRDSSVVDSAVMRFISYQTGLGIDDSPSQHIESPRLEQNYPNPFNPISEIGFRLPASGQAGIAETGHVMLKVYDLLGREVATRANEQKTPGTYTAEFDAGGLASGVYICRLQVGSFVQTKNLLLLLS